MKKRLERPNFETLVLAGVGAVGGSLLRLGGDLLDTFGKVILVDVDPDSFLDFRNFGFTFLQGSVEDGRIIENIANEMAGRGLFVNLCADVDNVRLRRMLGDLETAYVDSCAGVGSDPQEQALSRIMEYTLTPVASPYPHWLCWGINPGMVEIIARKIIRDCPRSGSAFDVTVFENDQLYSGSFDGRVAVGWCPSALIEEVMLFPSLEIRNGAPVEGGGRGAVRATAFWEGCPVASRIVAHEDIWNMQMLDQVRDACFVYGLHPDVMAVLEGGTAEAEQLLRVPPAGVPVSGLEQVAVKVSELETGWRKTLCWRTDHFRTWREQGMNAVQFQTATSMLLAIRLLQLTRYGTLPGSYCAADLPIDQEDWQQFDLAMSALDIQWQDGHHLDLSFRRGRSADHSDPTRLPA